MVEIKVRSDLPKFGLFLTDLERRQIPFAMSQAINSTAFDVRKHIVDRVFPSSFEMRNKRFISASMRVDKAKKTNLRASVFDHLQRGNLAKHAEGGSKTPRGRNLTIPSRSLAKRRSGKGVPKGLRPRAALSKKNTFKTTVKGQPVIARRKGKKGGIEILYVLEKRARLRRRFPFHREAERIIRTRFAPNFDKAFRKAVATATPRLSK